MLLAGLCKGVWLVDAAGGCRWWIQGKTRTLTRHAARTPCERSSMEAVIQDPVEQLGSLGQTQAHAQGRMAHGLQGWHILASYAAAAI